MPENLGRPIQAGNTQMEFTNSLLNGRKLIRSIKNEIDKCTLVSIFPKDIEEIKPTIEPGKFFIKAGTWENPSSLVVEGSSWWRDIDVEQPMLEIPVGSVQIADSIIKDYCNGMLGFSGDSMPGLFFVQGEHKITQIKINYQEKLREVKAKQDNWFKILVRLADSLWARTNGNPLTIMDDMRIAAKSLNLNDKPWLKDFQIAEQVRCFACGALRNPTYPICPTCRAIDPQHPLSRDIRFASNSQ